MAKSKRTGPRTAAEHEAAINEALSRFVAALNEAQAGGFVVRDPLLERRGGSRPVEVARSARVEPDFLPPPRE